MQSWIMLLGELVYSAEVVGHFVVEYGRRVKSVSYRSHIQFSLLPIAMTEKPLQTRRRAKALRSSLAIDDGMITGVAGTAGMTITRRDPSRSGVLLHYSCDCRERMVVYVGHREVDTRRTYLGCQATQGREG